MVFYVLLCFFGPQGLTEQVVNGGDSSSTNKTCYLSTFYQGKQIKSVFHERLSIQQNVKDNIRVKENFHFSEG